MKGLLVALAWLLGIAGFMVMAFAFEELSRATATASVDDASLWIHTPHVTPGASIEAEVKVYGGVRAGIRRIVARGGAEPMEVTGRGKHWGFSIRSKSSDSGEDGEDFTVVVPADHPEGQPLKLTVEVEYIRAVRGINGFSNDVDRARFELDLPVLSTGGRVLQGVLDAGRALAMFALLVWIYLRGGPALQRFEDQGQLSEAATEGLGYLLLCVGCFIAAAGYPLFAQPLMAGVGHASDAFAVVAMIVWMAVPPFVALRVHRRRPDTTTYTLSGLGVGAVGPLESLIPALRREVGVEPRRRGRALELKRAKKAWVRLFAADPLRIEQGLRLVTADNGLMLQTARALAGVIGPFTLDSQMVNLDVRPDRSIEELEADQSEQIMVVAREMMAQIEAMHAQTQALLDRRNDENQRR